MRRRTAVLLAALAAAAAAVALAVPVLWLEVDESAVPPATAVRPLPDGAQVTSTGKGCGSGGCWLELDVEAPAGMSGDELATAVVPEGDACSVRSAVDLRRVCTGVVRTAPASATFSVQYQRLLGS